MPFDHAATTEWGRWLRAVFASRSPNVQVVGQNIEDALRAVVLAADVRHLATPIRWAQAATRRSVGAVLLEVSRLELHCQSRGGLWVQDVDTNQDTLIRVADGPLTAVSRTGIVDFGNIPTVSLVGGASIVEANPASTFPVIDASAGSPHIAQPIFLPFGKVLVLSGRFQNGALELGRIQWLEIP